MLEGMLITYLTRLISISTAQLTSGQNITASFGILQGCSKLFSRSGQRPSQSALYSFLAVTASRQVILSGTMASQSPSGGADQIDDATAELILRLQLEDIEDCCDCRVEWKRSTCAQWRDDRLLARANQVVQRDTPRLEINDPVRIERVQQATQMLRERHNCAHALRRYVASSHQCEECTQQLPSYIFECRQC
jgi:hypothetical protein